MKKNKLKLGFLSVSFLLASYAMCDPEVEEVAPNDSIYFNGEVTFEDRLRIKPEVLAECEMEKNIIIGVSERAKKNNLPISNEKAPRELTISIVNATPGIFVFGNLGSVPATLDIKFKVVEGEKVLLDESKHCETKIAGFLGMQPSACNKLEKCAVSAGTYVSERVRRILYQ